MTNPDYYDLMERNTRGLLWRESESTEGEWQIRCDGCMKSVWAEDATEADDERFCDACVVEMNREFEEAMAR